MLSLFVALAMGDVEKQTLTAPPIEGVYYAPKSRERKLPAILVLHGSEGSVQFTDFTAKALAEEGYPALAVRYFGGKDQPKNLTKVPIECLDRAMEWLTKRPEVDPKRIGILGFSRGAELALSYASFNRSVKAVVNVSPTGMRFQGFIDMATPTRDAAFTYKGKDLPYATVEFRGKSLAETYAPFLKAPDSAPEWIQAQKVNGPILLISGQKDVVWPSSMLCRSLVDRLKAAKFKHEVVWRDYPDAGHVLLAKLPPGATESLAPTQFGGTKAGVFKALQDSWPTAISFLKKHLSGEPAVGGAG